MKLTRRFLAMLLAFSMTLSMVTPAFASEVETVAEPEAEAVVEEVTLVEAEPDNEAASTEEPVPEITDEGGAVEPEPPAGSSEENPYQPEWAWNDAQTEATAEVTVPAGETFYVAITFAGLELTVNGGEPVVVNGSRWAAEIHTIINDGDEDAVYTLCLAVPSGSMENPEVLTELGWIDLALEEGDQDGYYYTFTADGDGSATFYFGSVTEGVEADIVVTNMRSYAQKSLLADGVDNYGLELTVDVADGDELSIQVLVVPDSNWDIAAAEITWIGSFNYAPGSEKNPIFPEFVWNDEYTEATATVTAPVGTTYYAVYGAGMCVSINGGEPQLLVAQGMGRVPAVFSITNDGEAAAEYTLVLTYVEGSQQNPEVLYGLGTSYASLEAGDQDGYYYTYTVENDGTLEFAIASVTEGVEADISVTMDNSYANPTLLADGVDGVLSVPVTEGTVLTIQVVALPDNSWAIPAAEVEWTVNYPAGTELNPIFPEFQMNAEGTEGTATVTVPANTTLHYATYYAGMYLSINGGEAVELVSAGRRMPAYFTVVNDTDEAAEYQLHIAYPAGHQMNQEELTALGTSYTSLKAGDNDGHYYTYTAAADGVLEFSIAVVTEGVEADVSIFNNTTYAQRSVLYDAVDGVASIAVTAGDVLTIQVVALPDANWAIPAAEVEWTINYPVGHELNPLTVEFAMNEDYTEGTATVTVPANSTLYCATQYAGLYLSINGGEAVELVSAGRRMPAYFTVVNDTDEAAEFQLHIGYPAGHQMNPEELSWLGTSYATLEEGDSDGYYYTYTAEADGVLEFSIASVTEGVEADVSVFNNSTYAQHSVLYDGVEGVATIAVTEGDVLTIQVVALPDNTWAIPAAEVEWTINYTAGHELNPIMLQLRPDENNQIDYTVIIPANTTHYYSAYGIGGMLLSVNGGEAVELVAQGMGRVPVTFSVTNDTDAEAEFALHMEYPLGNQLNPAEPMVYVEGESWDEAEGWNLATVKEGDWYGYNYSWTAPAAGELTITMSNGKAGWFYVMNNMTSYIYGDNHYSCSGDALTETITVSAGDEIVLVVNSCGASAYDVTPAGDVHFFMSYVKYIGTEENPLLPEWSWNENQTEATASFVVPAGETFHYGITMSGMMMTVNGGEAIEVHGSRFMPDPYTYENTTDEAVEVTLHLFYAEGTTMNPTDIEEGTTSIDLEAGSQGAYFTYIAPDRGEVTITMHEGETGWEYFVNNVTNWHYGDTHWSDDAPLVASETLSVSKGDELQIFVTTYDPASMWSAPAGTVSFDVSFEGAEGTENNPIAITEIEYWQFETIPANDSVWYQARISGMCLTAWADENVSLMLNGELYTANDGVIYVELPAAMGRPMPTTFGFINDNDMPVDVEFVFNYPWGSEMNPAEMTLGKKNSAYVEADDKDGIIFSWTATGNGLLEFNMNTKAGWQYLVDNLSAGVYGDMRFSDVKGDNKTYTRVSKGDLITIMVNTYDPESWNTPAGVIEFTPKLITSYNETLLAGKNVTLKVMDDTNGKTVAANKATWAMAYPDGTEVPAEVATLKSGKLTAGKNVSEITTVLVTAQFTNSQGRETGVAFTVNISPAAAKVDIYNSEYIPEASGPSEDPVNNQTLTMYGNGYSLGVEAWPHLSAVVSPDGALGEVTWKSSNEKILEVHDGELWHMWYNGKPGTGSVTITATAADGSGKKATVKVNVAMLAEWITVASKTGAVTLGAGKSMNMVATVDPNATNKKVTWSIKMWNEDYTELVDVPADIAVIDAKSGKLTAGKKVADYYDIYVIATSQDAGQVMGENCITVQPLASKVVINDAPATMDLSGWPYAYLSAETLDAEGNSISNDVTWKSSSTKIATVDEYGTVEFLKTGSVTITATTTDGSNKKASVKITVVKSPAYVQLPETAIIAAGKNLDLSKAVEVDAEASNKKLTWAFEDAELAASLGIKVNNGKVTSNAKKITEPVTLALTATAVLGDDYGWNASATVLVTIYPATKTVSIYSGSETIKKAAMTAGETMVLFAESDPANAANQYTWKSSNEKIATVEVNRDGSVTVTAVGEKTGNVTITATATDGTNKNAKVTITVKAAQ